MTKPMEKDQASGVDLPPASRLLGREIMGRIGQTGALLIGYEAKPEFCNRHGTVQGGFLSAMLDSAMAIGLLHELPANKTVVTKTLTTRFLKPAWPGPYQARVDSIAIDGSDATVTATLSDPDGVEVAIATAELRILDIN
jgi:acyl-coenzyme A thioesterase PaaI-like protein